LIIGEMVPSNCARSLAGRFFVSIKQLQSFELKNLHQMTAPIATKPKSRISTSRSTRELRRVASFETTSFGQNEAIGFVRMPAPQA
jgi:hypothetical protein